MHIAASALLDFNLYAEGLQGTSPETKKTVLSIASLLEVFSLTSVEKVHNAFQGLRHLIDQNTQKEAPDLLDRIAIVEREACGQVEAITAPAILPIVPAAPAAPAAAAAATDSDDKDTHPNQSSRFSRKRFPEAHLDGEKEAKHPYKGILSPLSKLPTIPTLSDLFISYGNSMYALWTSNRGPASPHEAIINIQEGNCFQHNSTLNKIGIQVAQTADGIIIQSIFIDSIRTDDKEIPDKWSGIIREAVGLLIEICS